MTTDPSLLSRDQRRRLFAQFRDLGIRDRAERMRVVNALIWREAGSTSDLFGHEASSIIDSLIGVTKAQDPKAALEDLVERAEDKKAELGAVTG